MVWNVFRRQRTLIFLLFLLLSCTGTTANNSAATVSTEPYARPLAILQTGEHPLWFQLTEDGPVLLESIEDAVFSAALVPWPLALHVRFFHERENEIVMAVNRGGFMKLAPITDKVQGIAMYRFGGGEFWRQYTVGGFVFYNESPAALLYLDDRFLDSAAPIPTPRTWTFNMESNTPFPLEIPALEFFPVEKGWSADTLRAGSDGLWYYRVSKKSGAQPEIRMLRTADLSQAGEDISVEDFFNSAPRRTEVLHHALPPLPEGFVYTGTGRLGDSLFAAWEEQVDYNTGAAGFIVMKISE